jgi:Pyruvate phosphate dikinase, AMP/ATP-binding domain
MAIIADFNRRFLDPATPVSRISRGSLGGKAQGLVAIREALHAEVKPEDFLGISFDIPSLAILCTDTFEAYLTGNDLREITSSGLPDERIGQAFQRADLPFEILGDLRSLVEQVHSPLAIRSSSDLEDAKHQPFAGIYETKMIPNNLYDPDVRFRQLVEAIKFVYASTFSRRARDYRKANGFEDKDEKMAVMIQEIVGKRYPNRFYPELSGVARSYNYYPIQPARPEDGVVSLALGLGKTIVDGGICWTYSPAYPKVEPPYLSVRQLVKDSQVEFWAVNMGEPPEYDPIHETEYLALENIITADQDGSLRYLASTYDPQSDRLFAGTSMKGPRVLTFAPLLKLKELPFNDLMIALLTVCQKALGDPVEIEFAMTFDPHRFGFLQVRPMLVSTEKVQIEDQEMVGENVLLASDHALGNGVNQAITDIVYVKPEGFEMKHTREIVLEIEYLNRVMLEKGLPYMLIAIGRLGTTDPWLGIPANWGQVCAARVIVEATWENARVELSQGTHYFHNMVNSGTLYFLLPFSSPYGIDWDWLNHQPVVEETGFLRHVRLAKPLHVKVDGRHSRGLVTYG